MKTLILCSAAHKEAIIHHLLRDQKKPLFDLEVQSFSQFIEKYLLPPENLYRQAQRLQKLPLHIFQKAVKDVTFVEELLHYREEFDRFGVDISSLPIKEEIKEMLLCLQDHNYATFWQELSCLEASHIRIHDDVYDLFTERVKKVLCQNGATLFHYLPTYAHQGYRVIAATARDQFEAATQFIIRHQLPLTECAFVFADASAGEINLASSVLRRYQVPFTPLRRENACAQKFLTLLRYYQQPDAIHLRELIAAEVFTNANRAFFRFYDHYMDENGIFTSFLRFSEDDKDMYLLAQEAEKVRLPLAQALTTLAACSSLRSFIERAYSLLADGQEEKKQLKMFLQERGDLMEEDYLPYLIQELSCLSLPAISEEGILFSTLQKGLRRRYLFVFDVSENNYPAFHGLQGIITEKDIANSAYPSLQVRYKQHLKQLDYLFHSEQSFFFLPQTSYAGKNQEFALLLEERELTPFQIPIYRPETTQHSNIAQLSAQNAKQAFFQKDGTLKGSVSAFECYIHNPYDYFLQYGLGLRQKDEDDLGPKDFGNVLHNFMAFISEKYGKQYPTKGQEDLEAYMQKVVEEAIRYSPLNAKKIKTVYTHLQALIQEELAFLQEMETGSNLAVTHSEWEFTSAWPFSDLALQLHGKIDRVDQCGDAFVIFDYKSSKHSLSEKNVLAAQQLQLLTYTVIYQALQKGKALGCFYINFLASRQKQESYQFSLKNGVQEKEDDDKDSFKEKYLRGVAFSKEIRDYIPDRHCFVNSTKEGFNKKYIWDISKVIAVLETIYRAIYTDLRAGNIPLNLTADYPKFPEIYHYSPQEKEETISYSEESLQKGEDDETE